MTTALVGRSTELTMLEAFCRRAGFSGASLLLSGEPGVGKTALLDAISEWATGEGFGVLRAYAVRSEVEAEFSTLNQLLLPLEESLARLPTEDQLALSQALGFVDGSSRDTSAVAAAARALIGLADVDHPMLLVVDDVQWVDRSSAEVLGLLVRRLDGSRTGFIGASRPHGTRLLDGGLMPCAPVPPLDPTAARALITRHHPELDRRDVSRLLARSGGNPLALLELSRVLGTGRLDESWGHGPMLPLSRRVQHGFAADIQALPVKTRRLLLLLALEGTGDLTLWGGRAAAPELGPAEEVGLVSVNGATERLDFAHPLVPVTVTALATSDDRRTAHHELSQLLTSWPARRAPHLAEASTEPDERVAAELEAAAPSLARGGDATASVALYLRSAALSANPANQARRLARAAYLRGTVTGDLLTAGNFLRAARRAEPDVVVSLSYAMASAAVALHGNGDPVTAHRALVDAVRSHLADPYVDRRALVEAMQGLLDVCQWTQRPDHWGSLVALLTELPGEETAVLRLQVETLFEPPPASGDAFDRLGPGLEQLVADGSPTTLVRLAEWAVRAGRLSPLRARLEAVVADGRERGGSIVAIAAICCLAEDAFTTGDWDRAQLLADEGLAWCDRQNEQLRQWTLRWVKALVAAGRGDLSTVGQHTDEMLQWAGRHGVGRVHNYAHHARAVAALGTGHLGQADREVAAIIPTGSRLHPGPGTLDSALCVVDASRAQGLERAPAQPGAADHPFDLARAHLAYGQQLRRSRSTSTARAHLRTALAIFERLDARPWVERTRIELDATAETRNQAEPTLALTPQERTVALLAASGQTNKQIAEQLYLTHRTVAAHLHQVFPKLNVSSRAALRDALDTPGRDPASLVSP